MEFLIFTKYQCNWCTKTKELLKANKLYFEEMIYGEDFDREYLRKFLNKEEGVPITLPQIIDVTDKSKAVLVGGYAELVKYIQEKPATEV